MGIIVEFMGSLRILEPSDGIFGVLWGVSFGILVDSTGLLKILQVSRGIFWDPL